MGTRKRQHVAVPHMSHDQAMAAMMSLAGGFTPSPSTDEERMLILASLPPEPVLAHYPSRCGTNGLAWLDAVGMWGARAANPYVADAAISRLAMEMADVDQRSQHRGETDDAVMAVSMGALSRIWRTYPEACASHASVGPLRAVVVDGCDPSICQQTSHGQAHMAVVGLLHALRTCDDSMAGAWSRMSLTGKPHDGAVACAALAATADQPRRHSDVIAQLPNDGSWAPPLPISRWISRVASRHTGVVHVASDETLREITRQRLGLSPADTLAGWDADAAHLVCSRRVHDQRMADTMSRLADAGGAFDAMCQHVLDTAIHRIVRPMADRILSQHGAGPLIESFILAGHAAQGRDADAPHVICCAIQDAMMSHDRTGDQLLTPLQCARWDLANGHMATMTNAISDCITNPNGSYIAMAAGLDGGMWTRFMDASKSINAALDVPLSAVDYRPLALTMSLAVRDDPTCETGLLGLLLDNVMRGDAKAGRFLACWNDERQQLIRLVTR